MSKVFLYLDDVTQALVEEIAKESGLYKSRSVAKAIRRYAAHEWPGNWTVLGAHLAHFPLREDA